MKRTIMGLAVLMVMLILNSTALPAVRPRPFGLEVGKTSYEACSCYFRFDLAGKEWI